ncbi:MAG TPA: 2OG-Fe(II) oxygenase [Saprospiraceae bacterium]|nr:2OG-Fe(II) oxygenase [Saprospiraceae bacterium]
MQEKFDFLIDDYILNKVGIDKNFLSAALTKGLSQNIVQLLANGQMSPARIGQNDDQHKATKIRSDMIYWMDKSHENVFEQEFLALMEDLILYLNKTCYAGINAYEFHYALYEEGAAYGRHKDRFRNDSDRQYSVVNYLNADWVEEDGGLLLLYKDEGTQMVMPMAQTTVFFKCDEMEHEVTMSKRSRMSITGWLKRSIIA